MSDGLTSERLKNDKAAWNHVSKPSPALIHRIMAFGFIGAAMLATTALWWQFGETVFVTSVMNAILACF